MFFGRNRTSTDAVSNGRSGKPNDLLLRLGDRAQRKQLANKGQGNDQKTQAD